MDGKDKLTLRSCLRVGKLGLTLGRPMDMWKIEAPIEPAIRAVIHPLVKDKRHF